MNPHALAGTSPSSWRVCLFRHFDVGTGDCNGVSWIERHRAALQATLEDGETLLDADRVTVSRRRRVPRALPQRAFILGVTERRIVAWRASTWLARPLEIAASWNHSEGVALSSAPLGRLHFLLPDRTIITLRPYGGRNIKRLAR